MIQLLQPAISWFFKDTSLAYSHQIYATSWNVWGRQIVELKLWIARHRLHGSLPMDASIEVKMNT